jgi:preprotein translocase subunit SecA
VVEYQREGFDMFNQMMEGIKEEAAGYVFNLEVQVEEQPTVTVDPSQAVRLPAGGVMGGGDVPDDDVPGGRTGLQAKGLNRNRQPQNLQYTAPAIDGEAGDGAPVLQQPSAPALGIGPGGSPVPASPAQTSARPPASTGRGARTTGQPSSGPSRNAPCYCGSGKKYKRCHGAPGAV